MKDATPTQITAKGMEHNLKHYNEQVYPLIYPIEHRLSWTKTTAMHPASHRPKQMLTKAMEY